MNTQVSCPFCNRKYPIDTTITSCLGCGKPYSRRKWLKEEALEHKRIQEAEAKYRAKVSENSNKLLNGICPECGGKLFASSAQTGAGFTRSSITVNRCGSCNTTYSTKTSNTNESKFSRQDGSTSAKSSEPLSGEELRKHQMMLIYGSDDPWWGMWEF